ncbi:MAG: ATP-binding protein, partial [Longimicrobiales bacterium]|nr:ATP-binding protein [Longimicrobiales bacterium]
PAPEDEAGIRVDVDAPAALPCTGDAGRITQVLENLLANAFRYAPEGSRIRLRVEAPESRPAEVPADVWAEFIRAQALAAGREAPRAGAAGAFRVIGIASAGMAWFVFLFLLAGIVTFLFAFVLGDQGRYRQHLAALAHANLVAALGAVLVTPLRIAQRDPQLTLSVGTFLEGLLEPGFLLAWFRLMDLFALWSWVVLGILLSRIDTRRSAVSATGILAGVFLVIFMGIAWLQARSMS